MRRAESIGAALLGLSVLAAPLLHAAGEEYGFMPPGGRDLFATLLPDDGSTLSDAASRTGERADWEAWVRAREPDLHPAEIATVAAYAALNFPLGAAERAALAAGDVSVLPPDGKDLAINQCQFCHSFFTGYLMQKKDETSWLATFKAPFHAEIPMDATQRATFAAYSALNMPLDIEDVPTELRF